MASFIFEADCPFCKKTLLDFLFTINEQPSVKLKIKCKSGEGIYRISALYESHEHLTRIAVDEHEVPEYFCPFCNSKLQSDRKCDKCQTFMIQLAHHPGGKLFFCPHITCSNHFISFENTEVALWHLYRKYS